MEFMVSDWVLNICQGAHLFLSCAKPPSLTSALSLVEFESESGATRFAGVHFITYYFSGHSAANGPGDNNDHNDDDNQRN